MSDTTRDSRLLAKGYALDAPPAPKAKYVLLKQAGSLLFSSGALPSDGSALCGTGKVPTDVTPEKAKEMAALATANVLRAVRASYGSLDCIKQVVKLNGYVNSAAGFSAQHLVVNGASELLGEVFEDSGFHARSAIGVAELPLNACLEIEIIFELTDTAAPKE